MARPKKIRRVGCRGVGRGFKPIGIPMTDLDSETLEIDELEALRLADLEGLYQEAAATHMGVSRPTFARILRQAREKVARALVEEAALLIGEGVTVAHATANIPCPVHDAPRRQGRGCRCRHRHGQRQKEER